MFFSNIDICGKYKYMEPKLEKAYEWLRNTELAELKPGRYPIDNEEIAANVQEYTTEPEEQRFFETHEKYFDIQYVVSGEEFFGICKREILVIKEIIEKDDLIFYEEPVNPGRLLLKEGDLIVVEPETAHKPRCMSGSPIPVKKIVIKVRI